MIIAWEIPSNALELLYFQLERVRTEEAMRVEVKSVEWSPIVHGCEFLVVETRVPRSARAYQSLLFGLLAIDLWCRQRRQYPSVLDNGRITYAMDTDAGRETWPSTPALFARGEGNCDAIACDRAAEWTLAGRPCAPLLELSSESLEVREFHVVVVDGLGGREDPTQEIERRTSWQIRS